MFSRAGEEPRELVRRLGRELAKNRWWHSFELPDGRKIEGANSIEGLKKRLSVFPISENLSGQRVLDIGAWDGWFSFELERRGAEVVAVDSVESRNFRFLHRELGSKIDYRILDVYELTPEKLGRFDIVLFLGVLYHLKHPLLALERVCSLSRNLTAVQTFVSPDTGPPAMEFYETDELGGQFDNWVGPNVECVLAMCRAAGFARVELLDVSDCFAAVACFRHFLQGASPTQAQPELRGCEHMTNLGVNFSSKRDDYVTCWFTSVADNLSAEDIHASAGNFEARPVFVDGKPPAWQVNFKLPPGLEPGWHDVRVRTRDSAWSNALRIAVDLPLQVELLTIAGVSDGRTWKPFEVEVSDQPIMTLWIEGVPENGDRSNIRIKLGEYTLKPRYVSKPEPGKPVQVNVDVPLDIPPGDFQVEVSIEDCASRPAPIKLTKQ